MQVGFFEFSIYAIALWRLAHLLGWEDGPFAVFAWLQGLVKGWPLLGAIFSCFYCLSLWLAFLPAWRLSSNWSDFVILSFALSGAAIFLNQLVALISLDFLQSVSSAPDQKNSDAS